MALSYTEVFPLWALTRSNTPKTHCFRGELYYQSLLHRDRADGAGGFTSAAADAFIGA